MQLRFMRREDAPDVARLCGELGYPSTTAEVLARFEQLEASPRDSVVVAADDDAVVGWVHVHEHHTLESDPVAEIGGLVVDSRYRSQGVGGRLMLRAEEWAIERRCSRIRLRSNVARAEAHAFYERLGYRRLKTQFAFAKTLTAEPA